MSRSLLFDLDGTLTDPQQGITACFRHAAEALGHRADGDLRRLIGPPLRDSFREILQTDDPERVEEAVRLFRERFSTVGLFENRVYDGVQDVLQQARTGGWRLFVVTSKPGVYADRIVDHFGLRAHFVAVHGPTLAGERGDKAELLGHVLEVERIDPDDACMVGDRKHDVSAARAHGVRSVGVCWGYGTRTELHEAGAHAVVDTLDELLPAVRGLARP